MEIKQCSDYEEMSEWCADDIISELRNNSNQLLCTATGYSPSGVYQKFSSVYESEPEVFAALGILKLDEWGGIAMDHPNSCETFIQQKIAIPLDISTHRYISFNSNPLSPEKECERIQKELVREGPIDMCILGLGKNGHIGFNEPSEHLQPHCHIARLSQESLQHQMADAMEIKPTYGLTLGMADILQSKKIVLLLTGFNKGKVISQFLSKQITTQLPASFLWLHPNVTCYIDATAL